MSSLDLPSGPPPELLFKRKIRLFESLRELVRARGMIATLAERDLRVRYKQAVIGPAWVVVTPVILMLVFSVFFKRAANINTGDIPYPLFTYLGLLPWSFFSSSMGAGASSLVSNSALLNKIYCPREVWPLASLGTAAVDTVVSTSVLGVLFLVYGYAPRATSVWVPVLALVALAFTTGLTLLFSGLFVYIRDLRQTIPMLLQIGLFATPVGWQTEKIPDHLRGLYATFNPLVAVIDGLRRTVLEGRSPAFDLLVPAAISSTVLLMIGYWALKHMETGFADVA